MWFLSLQLNDENQTFTFKCICFNFKSFFGSVHPPMIIIHLLRQKVQKSNPMKTIWTICPKKWTQNHLDPLPQKYMDVLPLDLLTYSPFTDLLFNFILIVFYVYFCSFTEFILNSCLHYSTQNTKHFTCLILRHQIFQEGFYSVHVQN